MAVIRYAIERDDVDCVSAYVKRNSATMPQHLVEVYVLCFERKMTTSDAAREMGITPGSARQYLVRLRQMCGRV